MSPSFLLKFLFFPLYLRKLATWSGHAEIWNFIRTPLTLWGLLWFLNLVWVIVGNYWVHLAWVLLILCLPWQVWKRTVLLDKNSKRIKDLPIQRHILSLKKVLETLLAQKLQERTVTPPPFCLDFISLKSRPHGWLWWGLCLDTLNTTWYKVHRELRTATCREGEQEQGYTPVVMPQRKDL